MGSINETVKTVNSTVRTVAFVGLVGLVAAAGYMGYDHYTANQRALMEKEAELQQVNVRLGSLQNELDSTRVELAEKIQRIEKLETAMHLLKTDQRLAQLKVLSIDKDENGQAVSSQLEFVELSPSGDPLSPPKRFTLPGDLIYIDNWVVKFEDAYVEKADIERGTSLVLFRRIFSEKQLPSQGVSLDEIGMRPQAYARGGAMSEFEKRLWGEFWEFANDSKKAAELGIRAANGEAISIQVREGMSYNLRLRSSGGLSFQPVSEQPASTQP